MEQIYLSFSEHLNFSIFLIVIISSYFVSLLNSNRLEYKELRIITFSFIASLCYNLVNILDAGLFISSYFMSIGVYSIIEKIIKWGTQK